jgi:hypothetical protein
MASTSATGGVIEGVIARGAGEGRCIQGDAPERLDGCDGRIVPGKRLLMIAWGPCMMRLTKLLL